MPSAPATEDPEHVAFRTGCSSPELFPNSALNLILRRIVNRQKFLTTLAAPSPQQLVIAEFLENGGYDRHVKRLRGAFEKHVDQVRQAIAKYFPEGTRISRPAGGHLCGLNCRALWMR